MLVVGLVLSDGMDNFARVVGRGLAERIIQQPGRYTPTGVAVQR